MDPFRPTIVNRRVENRAARGPDRNAQNGGPVSEWTWRHDAPSSRVPAANVRLGRTPTGGWRKQSVGRSNDETRARSRDGARKSTRGEPFWGFPAMNCERQRFD